jgi:hypothetical protein
MKLSKPLSALILIASALLLSAAKNRSANAQSESPYPRNEQQSQSAGQPSETSNPTPAPTASEPAQTISIPAPQTSASDTNPEDWGQRLYDHIWPPLWSTFSPPTWSNWGLIIAASVAAWVALKTLTAINRSNRVALRVARVTKIAAQAGKESADTARKALLLQFRPKLIVRNFVVTPPIGDGLNGTLIFIRNYPVRGQFYVANVGGSPAKITESLCIVHWLRGPLPMQRPYEGNNGNYPIMGTISAGGRATAIFESSATLDISHTELGSIEFPDLEPLWHIWVMGWIEYADELGFGRRTAFCRRWDHRTNRFVVVDDPDYEHAE